MGDPRESSSYTVTPHLKYNTVGGVNGPLVILDNVRGPNSLAAATNECKTYDRARSNFPDITRLSA